MPSRLPRRDPHDDYAFGTGHGEVDARPYPRPATRAPRPATTPAGGRPAGAGSSSRSSAPERSSVASTPGPRAPSPPHTRNSSPAAISRHATGRPTSGSGRRWSPRSKASPDVVSDDHPAVGRGHDAVGAEAPGERAVRLDHRQPGGAGEVAAAGVVEPHRDAVRAGGEHCPQRLFLTRLEHVPAALGVDPGHPAAWRPSPGRVPTDRVRATHRADPRARPPSPAAARRRTSPRRRRADAPSPVRPRTRRRAAASPHRAAMFRRRRAARRSGARLLPARCPRQVDAA